MSSSNNPVPLNEMERIITLSDYDLDYSGLENNFKDIIHLAARVAGTEISLINLIDSFTQWSIAHHGLDVEQMPREDSVCQYTIMEEDHFEVEDLSADARFTDKFYVDKPLSLRYYFGIPLKTSTGFNIGALCVLDTNFKKLTPEKVELLKLIANEIVNRLNTIKLLQELKSKLNDAKETHKRVAHDIRGPLSGIIGISEIISERGNENQLDEVMDFVTLIHKSSRSILDLADEILTEEKKRLGEPQGDGFNLTVFKEKLEKLYLPQAQNKNIALNINNDPKLATIPISKNKLLQIVGNLISNAIKFTPQGGSVTVDLDLALEMSKKTLKITVSDTGEGLTEDSISSILSGTQGTSQGTGGESGYGFGLAMVKHLVDTLKGKMEITSEEGKGAKFVVTISQ
ncbi:sensor histidine kinase [Pedobacter frigiditerrae]|uniref:histidine kinase n=1 Tax=Pedobacter frigiditerrae TaxID=2530452 RepID=A0A4V2MI84_9SPHI|nr:GAF domain-containing sensor histidine kinase [Pedobacter frigiditerrae]TCC89406.1 sensor histidine kinase [Pedobacter frigiditerrae]